MNIYVYPYNAHSESAKLLADRLGAKRIRLSNSTYTHKPENLVINWGSTSCPYPCLNPSSALVETVDKLRLFRLFTKAGAADSIPEYWIDPRDIPDHAFPVYCRTTTTGRDGEGIVVAKTRDELVPAPLYTAGLDVCNEYRVTIFKGKVTDIQTKLPRQSHEGDKDPYVRTYDNGWGFRRVLVPSFIERALEDLARTVLILTGMDFCGIDVVCTDTAEFKVLEVNSAMGIEEGALERFAGAVEEYVASLAPPQPEPAPVESEAPEGNLEGTQGDYLDQWLDTVPLSPAGGVDYQSILIKIAGRLN